jgi:hypothetical protein
MLRRFTREGVEATHQRFLLRKGEGGSGAMSFSVPHIADMRDFAIDQFDKVTFLRFRTPIGEAVKPWTLLLTPSA